MSISLNTKKQSEAIGFGKAVKSFNHTKKAELAFDNTISLSTDSFKRIQQLKQNNNLLVSFKGLSNFSKRAAEVLEKGLAGKFLKKSAQSVSHEVEEIPVILEKPFITGNYVPVIHGNSPEGLSHADKVKLRSGEYELVEHGLFPLDKAGTIEVVKKKTDVTDALSKKSDIVDTIDTLSDTAEKKGVIADIIDFFSSLF